jgi:hypothetical protein
MKTCSCGNLAEERGALCARCAALKALELGPGATREEIKEAFHALAKVWHPDRFPRYKLIRAKAEEKQKTINAAYSFLMKSTEQEKPSPRRGEAEQERPSPKRGKADQEKSPSPRPGKAEQEKPSPRRGKAPWAERVKMEKRVKRPEEPQKPVPPTRDWRAAVKWRGILPRHVFTFPIQIALGCGALISAIAVGWVLLKPIDSALESNPVTATIDEEYKTSMRSAFGEFKDKIWDRTESIMHFRIPQNTNTIPARNERTEKSGPARTKSSRAQAPAAQGEHGVLPYITAGMTKSQVTAVQGNPTEATEDKLTYGKSELYFSNDQLIGWKIDPISSPIPVKLWPGEMIDPDLDVIAVGSTKYEVIKVEGTPTFFSENTFGYGKSEVYFKDNRVVSWKGDPSWPLRTDSR